MITRVSNLHAAGGRPGQLAALLALLALLAVAGGYAAAPVHAAPPSAERTYTGTDTYFFIIDDDTDQLYTMDTADLTLDAVVVGPCAQGDGFGLGLTRPRGLAVLGAKLWFTDTTTDRLYRLSPWDGCAEAVGYGVVEFGQGYSSPSAVAACDHTGGAWIINLDAKPGNSNWNSSRLAAVALTTGISNEPAVTFNAQLVSTFALSCVDSKLYYWRDAYWSGRKGELKSLVVGDESARYSGNCYSNIPNAPYVSGIAPHGNKWYFVDVYGAVDSLEMKTTDMCARKTTSTTLVEENADIGLDNPRGMALMTPPATVPPDDPSQSTRAFLQPAPGISFRPLPVVQTFELSDGDIYTSQRPKVADSSFEDATNAQGGPVVSVRITWSPVQYASFYEVESSNVHDPPVETDVLSLSNDYTEDFPASESVSPRLAAYRVRAVLENSTALSHELDIDGHRVIILPGATVYSPWSSRAPVLFSVGGSRLRATNDAPDSVDQFTERSAPVQELVNVVTSLAGIPSVYDDLFAVLAYFFVAVGIAGFVFYKGDMQTGALFLGCSFMAVICSIGGPVLVGLPWGWMALPGALMMVVALLSLKTKGVMG